MADNQELSSFQTQGTWTYRGSELAGQYEASRGYPVSPQQSNETATAYATRMEAYHNSSNQS